MPTPRSIAALFHRRWSMPLMATLHRTQGAKFVSLCHTLQANQVAVRHSLDHLIDLGWVRRNPGYGHPLRPEYILTLRGERLAPACAALDDTIDALGLREVALRRWSMPIVHAVSIDEPARFSAVAQRLDTITDRSLALSIRTLCGANIITRQVDDGFPPTSAYLLETPGHRLAPLLDRVAQACSV